MTKKQEILNYYLNESEKAIKKIHLEYSYNISPERLWLILTDYFEMFDNPVELIYKNLSSSDIIKIVTKDYLSLIYVAFREE